LAFRSPLHQLARDISHNDVQWFNIAEQPWTISKKPRSTKTAPKSAWNRNGRFCSTKKTGPRTKISLQNPQPKPPHNSTQFATIRGQSWQSPVHPKQLQKRPENPLTGTRTKTTWIVTTQKSVPEAAAQAVAILQNSAQFSAIPCNSWTIREKPSSAKANATTFWKLAHTRCTKTTLTQQTQKSLSNLSIRNILAQWTAQCLHNTGQAIPRPVQRKQLCTAPESKPRKLLNNSTAHCPNPKIASRKLLLIVPRLNGAQWICIVCSIVFNCLEALFIKRSLQTSLKQKRLSLCHNENPLVQAWKSPSETKMKEEACTPLVFFFFPTTTQWNRKWKQPILQNLCAWKEKFVSD